MTDSHEVSQVPGLGHANFDGRLNEIQLDSEFGDISDREIEAVFEANRVRLKQEDADTDYNILHHNNFLKCNKNLEAMSSSIKNIKWLSGLDNTNRNNSRSSQQIYRQGNRQL
jgi:hypothetical protein